MEMCLKLNLLIVIFSNVHSRGTMLAKISLLTSIPLLTAKFFKLFLDISLSFINPKNTIFAFEEYIHP